MSDDDKPLDLRDKLALEILNGLLAGNLTFYPTGGATPSSLSHSIFNHYTSSHEGDREEAKKRAEKLIRMAYMMADTMRRVRLTAFE